MGLLSKTFKSISIAVVSTAFFPSMASAQFFVTTSPPLELPAPVFNGGYSQPQELPSPLYNGGDHQPQQISTPIYHNGYSQPQQLPAPVYNGGPAPIDAPQPVYSGWQEQQIPTPHPNNYEDSFTLPNQGSYAPVSQGESYSNEVEAYRSIGQVSPVLNNQGYDTYVAPVQTYVPNTGSQNFSIAPAPQWVHAQQPQQPQQPQQSPYSACWQSFGSCISTVRNVVSDVQNSVPFQLGKGVAGGLSFVGTAPACLGSVGNPVPCIAAGRAGGAVYRSAEWLSQNVGSPADYVRSLFGR